MPRCAVAGSPLLHLWVLISTAALLPPPCISNSDCCLQGCTQEAEGYGFVLSDIWGFQNVSRHLLNIWRGEIWSGLIWALSWQCPWHGIIRGSTIASVSATRNCFICAILQKTAINNCTSTCADVLGHSYYVFEDFYAFNASHFR